MARKPRSWLRPVLRPIRRHYREVLLVSLFVNAIMLTVPLFVLQVYDRVVGHGGLTTLQALMLGMAVALIFDFVLRQARSRILHRVGLRVDIELARALFRKVSALPLQVLEARPAAFWQALFRDLETVRNTLSGTSAVLLIDLPFILLFFGLVVVIAAPVAWVLACVLVVLLVLALFSAISVGAASRREREAALARDGLLSEAVAGRSTVKALALDGLLQQEWEARQADTVERALLRGRRADAFFNLSSTISMLTTIALTGVGALAVLDQQMTIGALVAANILGSRFISPLVQLVNNWRVFAGYREAVDRLGEIFALDADRQELTLDLPRPQGRLSTEGLVFAYAEDAAPVIDQVTLRFGPSGLHGILGPNGSGKTTLLKLLQGLYSPSQGRVLLDDADVTQFSREQLASWIGYVPQECFLFAGTIRDNIAKSSPEATDDQVRRASAMAGVHDFVIDLPDGYGTEIGEAGQRLSGGQRQRIAIARALLRDPPALLLDEPTANLDREAAEELVSHLAMLSSERTVVVVTHSVDLLRACNSVMALKDGRIAVAGAAREVLPQIFGTRPQQAAAE